MKILRLHAVLLLALVFAIVVAALVPSDGPLKRAAIGWDAGVMLFIVATMTRLTGARSADDIRARAADLDQAGAAVLPLSVLAALASVGVVIGEAAGADPAEAVRGSILALVTVTLSWAFTHLIFALHYAHTFYNPDGEGDRGGLIFPGETEPDYWDFLHFALVIGVASQTADIQIADRRLRRIASLHSVTAFVFNTVIVALAVNLALGLLGR